VVLADAIWVHFASQVTARFLLSRPATSGGCTTMSGYFSKERVAELHAGLEEVHRQFAVLRENMCLRTYKTERGDEFAKHGFCRRLDTLVRSIDCVYELLPPDREEIPKRDVVVDAAIAIQAFTMNAFGCLDNIAWVLVYEKGIKGKGGKELERLEVGLGKKNVRDSLSKEFHAFLDGKQDWFGNLINFRDSLAHRIPLYIPPYVVPKPNIPKYNELEKAKWQEPAKSDPVEYEKVKVAQLALCQFVPGMTHSIFEQSPQIEFHS
jgi:hypothetical protein